MATWVVPGSGAFTIYLHSRRIGKAWITFSGTRKWTHRGWHSNTLKRHPLKPNEHICKGGCLATNHFRIHRIRCVVLQLSPAPSDAWTLGHENTHRAVKGLRQARRGLCLAPPTPRTSNFQFSTKPLEKTHAHIAAWGPLPTCARSTSRRKTSWPPQHPAAAPKFQSANVKTAPAPASKVQS